MYIGAQKTIIFNRVVLEAVLVVNFLMYCTKHGYLDADRVGLAYHRCIRGGGACVKDGLSISVHALLLGMRRTKGN